MPSSRSGVEGGGYVPELSDLAFDVGGNAITGVPGLSLASRNLSNWGIFPTCGRDSNLMMITKMVPTKLAAKAAKFP